MATYDVSFAGGVSPAAPIGQKSKVRFAFSWDTPEDWTVQLVTQLSGNLTFGKGNIAGQTFNGLGKFKDRVFVSFGSQYAMSAIGDPTGWEEQNIGAATVNFLGQAGTQDEVQAFDSMQGRLAVIGTKTIILWDVNADPSAFVLRQVLDNTGTQDPLSVQKLGDSDLIYLDFSGIRSLRAREQTLNSYVNDMGIAIDNYIKEHLRNYTPGSACGIVDPATKNYWLYIDEFIYCLAYYPSSAIAAWTRLVPCVTELVDPSSSTYNPPGVVSYTTVVGDDYFWIKGADASSISNYNDVDYLTETGKFTADSTITYENGTSLAGVTSFLFHIRRFVPKKFVVLDGRIYLRSDDNKIYLYGGTDNQTYDDTYAEVALPWLDFEDPTRVKNFQGFDLVLKGNWYVYASTNPQESGYTLVHQSPGNVVTETDSTDDSRHYSFSGSGTKLKLLFFSAGSSAAKIGQITIQHDPGYYK